MKKPICGFVGLACLLAAPWAQASRFDATGDLHFDSDAIATESFEEDTPLGTNGGGSVVADATSIHGAKLLRIPAGANGTVPITIPGRDLSVSVSAYVRGGTPFARLATNLTGKGP